MIKEAVLLAIGLAILGAFVYVPRIIRLCELKREIKMLDDKSSQETTNQSVNEIKYQLEAVNLAVNKIKVFLPREEEIAQLLKGLVHLAQQAHLEIVSVESQSKIDNKVYRETPIDIGLQGEYWARDQYSPCTPIDIGLQGEYWSLAQFLGELNTKMPWRVNVNRFNMQNIESKDSEKIRLLQLNLNIGICTPIH
jgi:Tfp pilus assembly protein PilO